MSGQWPPEWEDSELAFPGEGWLQQDPDTQERLSEVSGALASVPIPALPDAFEARISAAIAAEAASRAAGGAPSGVSGETGGLAGGLADGGTSGGTGDGASGGSAGIRPRLLGPARSRPRVRRSRRWLRPVVAIGSAVTCLVLAFVGYALIPRSGAPASSSMSAAAAPAASAASGRAAAGPFTGSLPGHQREQMSGASAGFAVTSSGISYSRATLATTVRRELARSGGQKSPPPTASPAGKAASSPAASASIAFGRSTPVPSPALAACVRHLTGNVTPSLVQRASYEGRAAYVIAVPSRVWVVGLGCTAARPRLIISVSLAS